MNERIKELAEQAGVSLTKTGIDGNGYKFEYTDQNQIKFAELIIQECARKVEDMIDDGWYADTEALKKHFGVAP